MNYPDFLSYLRIVLTVTAYPALFLNTKIFLVIVIIAGISDILDGFLARKLKQQTEYGAKLDSFADLLFYPSLFIWFCAYFKDFVLLQIWQFLILLVFFLIVELFHLLRHGSFGSLHLWSAKLTSALFFIFFLTSVFFDKINLYFFEIMFFVAFIHFFEEFIILIFNGNPPSNSKTIFHIVWKK